MVPDFPACATLRVYPQGTTGDYSMRGFWPLLRKIRRHAERVLDGGQLVGGTGCGLQSQPQAGGER